MINVLFACLFVGAMASLLGARLNRTWLFRAGVVLFVGSAVVLVIMCL